MAYTNSSLVSYTRLSPNHSGQRTHSIDRITPHCVVGQATAERIAEIFATTDRQASCNYGIGRDGRISLVVEEKNRSWCSSSKENDQRAITIEVASDSTAPYAFRDEAYAALIALCVDICKRNGKKKLLWLADKAKTLAYEPKSDEMILSVHRWFANKSCPGEWMYARMGDLASKVTAALGGENVDVSVPVVDTSLKKGSTGDAVKTMQTMLIACGYSCGNTGADGDFGKNTEAAVKAFQTATGLTVDGIYGPVTKAALEKAYANRSTSQPTTDNNEKAIWDRLFAAIQNPYGVSGVLANFYAESALKSTNLQNSFEKKLGMTDDEYTVAVDNGSYTNFVHDSAGYGLFQATYWSIKESLLNFAKSKGVSIGDREMQVDWFIQAMKNDYKAIWTVLTTAKTVREASDAVLLKFERPADQSETVQERRAAYGEQFFAKYGNAATTAAAPTADEQKTGTGCTASAVIAVAIGEIGYKEKASNASLDEKTANAGSANYTKYARDFDQKYPKWYNGKKNGYAWCDMFVDWCFLTAFGYEKALKLLCQPEKSAGAGCTYSLRYYKAKSQFHTSGPKPGDQIFFGTSIDNSSHTGIVEKVDGSKVYTIEGNTSDQVARRSYALNNSRILGYGRPAYDADGSTQPSTTTTQTDTSKPYYYRVRRSWADKSSQIAACVILQNAKNIADLNPGYKVFGEDGKCVYGETVEEQQTFTPYRVRVSISDLRIRKGPGTDYDWTGEYTGKGVFTITEVLPGQGSDSGWGRLKSGAGFISLDFCQRL